MKEYALIGYPLTHSFSKKYFTEKFEADNIKNCVYNLYELPDINGFPELLKAHPNLAGLNVTIPHKEVVIPFLDEVEEEAAKIGAVNVIKFTDGKIKGFNSDYQGFMQSLQKFYPCSPGSKALILGTGGAAKAVMAALDFLQITYKTVSRKPESGQLHYDAITPELLASYTLIINTTPLGTYPNTATCPSIPYQALTEEHYLYDLVYNPSETVFLKKGKEAGAHSKNGYEMLCLQAEVAWQIWNS
ncbi:shikimate dehydrogenase family protein [Adhaeribacter aquaticus]|uniref:shikimate dehydrogenase family protein n=1 Tax=Adhaeribacter aquaticus TaxID=299567 RepID=UPI000417450F|nr:shikimate dehydrogenase [Adhaeribacter aquaticus]